MPQVGVEEVIWDELEPGTTLVSQYYLITPDDIREEAEAYEDHKDRSDEACYGSIEFT